MHSNLIKRRFSDSDIHKPRGSAHRRDERDNQNAFQVFAHHFESFDSQAPNEVVQLHPEFPLLNVCEHPPLSIVWPSALVLCQYMQSNLKLKNKRVCELGTGTGLVSLWSGLLSAKSVVATDLEENLAFVQHNIDVNAPRSRVIQARALNWQKYTVEECQALGSLDFVFASDTLYCQEHHAVFYQLLLDLTEYCGQPDIVISFPVRSGASLAFLDLAQVRPWTESGLMA